MNIGIAGVEFNSSMQRKNGVDEAALRRERITKIPVSLRGCRIQIDGLPELAYRVVDTPGQCKRHTKVAVHIGGSRLFPNRQFVMFDSARSVTFIEEHIREVVVRRSKLRLQLERLLITGSGFLKTVLLAQRGPQVVVRRSIIRLHGERVAIVCDRIIGPVIRLQGGAEIRLGGCPHRGYGDYWPIDKDCGDGNGASPKDEQPRSKPGNRKEGDDSSRRE